MTLVSTSLSFLSRNMHAIYDSRGACGHLIRAAERQVNELSVYIVFSSYMLRGADAPMGMCGMPPCQRLQTSITRQFSTRLFRDMTGYRHGTLWRWDGPIATGSSSAAANTQERDTPYICVAQEDGGMTPVHTDLFSIVVISLRHIPPIHVSWYSISHHPAHSPLSSAARLPAYRPG